MGEDTNFIRQIKPEENKSQGSKIGTDNQDLVKRAENILDGNKAPSKLPKILKRPKRIGRKCCFGFLKNKKATRIVLIILLVFLVYNAIFGTLLLLKSKKLVANISDLQGSVAAQDLAGIKSNLIDSEKSLKGVKGAYRFMSWAKLIPYFGRYVSDTSHMINAGISGIEIGNMLVEVVEPYSDLLGFSGAEVKENGEKTAADRIEFIVKTIPAITPKLDEISIKLDEVNKELNSINPSRYPETFAGKEIRKNVESMLELVDISTNFIKNGKPLIEHMPELLGMEGDKLYLVIFQNDKELRPSGGFITAYSVMKVKNAKFEPVSSNDIYNLDARYKPVIRASDPIIEYIGGPYSLNKNYRLRDMNWSPDFSVSMDLFSEEVKKAGIDDVDGIIAVDTQLLVNLLEVLGPIGVPGFGNFSTEIIPECNCPQVIYELESFADIEGPIVWDPDGSGKIIYSPPNTDNRKKIIGPLMNSIMANAFGQPKEKMPDLFNAGFKSLMEKHILVYFYDDDLQKSAEDFGIGGVISEYEGDYLHINDANLGGRKSNLYVTYEVTQDINIAKDGSVEKTVEITYKNPEKYDGWLNSLLPNWVRIYVPKGSKLVSLEGLDKSIPAYEELGKTVFAGYFELRPLGVNIVTVKYRLPFRFNKYYKMLIQKQPGKDKIIHTIKIGKSEEEVVVVEDTQYQIKF